MTYLGDFLGSGSVDFKFATLAIAGTATTLSGGSVVVYKNNGTVESSAGVELTADFDNRVGLNHVGINLAADASFYSVGANFDVVLATGTANSVSLNNYTLRSFSIENRNQKPTGGTVAETTALSAVERAAIKGSVLAGTLGTSGGWGTVTVQDALQASWADGFGKASLPAGGTILTLFTPDNSGTARRFGTDDVNTPRTRTPF